MAGNSNLVYTRVLLLAFCFHIVISDEPQCTCSKYHYEISTLERLLRSEMKVEGMESEIKKYAEQMKQTEEETRLVLAELKKKSDDMDKVLEGKTSQIEQMSNDLVELQNKTAVDMDNALEETQSQIERMSEDLVEFRNQTANELKELAVTPLVAFRATDIADKSPATDQTLVFLTTVLNEGQGYDNTTGQFTAPTDGLYHLSVQLCFINKKQMYFDIVVDNVIVNSGKYYDADAHICCSADTTIVMKRNMKAWVKCANGYSSDFLYKYRHQMSIFSGFLVNKK